MDKIRRFAAQVVRWWSGLFQENTSVRAGGMVQAPPYGRVFDGVDYDLPLVLPGWMRRDLKPEAVQRYIHESARQTFRFQFDTPQRDGQDMPIVMPTEDPLKEWDWQTRERVLTSCHSTYHRNPLAKAAVDLTIGFVIGDGFNLACKNKEVERILTEFIDSPDNQIRSYEKECLRDLQLDGEIMLRIFTENGQIVAVPLRPWECQYIRTEAGFFRRKESFHFEFEVAEGDDPTATTQTKAEDVPADEMIHVAINKHGYELRGRPELFTILPWLRAHKEFLENRARENHWRGAFLWHAKIAANSPQVIASKQAMYSQPPLPGSILVTSDKEEWQALANTIRSMDAAEDGRQIKMMSITGMRMAEYMLGDGENANLASAKAQQLPALTRFEDFQQLLVEQVWYPLFTRVLQRAIDAGTLAEELEEQDVDGEPITDNDPIAGTETARRIKTLDAFEVSYEPIGEDSIQTVAQAFSLMLQDGVTSKQRYAEETGQDWTMIQKQQRRERLDDLASMARGEMALPPDMLAQMGMGAMDGEDDGSALPGTKPTNANGVQVPKPMLPGLNNKRPDPEEKTSEEKPERG